MVTVMVMVPFMVLDSFGMESTGLDLLADWTGCLFLRFKISRRALCRRWIEGWFQNKRG